MSTLGLIGGGLLYTSMHYYLKTLHYERVKMDLFGRSKNSTLVTQMLLSDNHLEGKKFQKVAKSVN